MKRAIASTRSSKKHDPYREQSKRSQISSRKESTIQPTVNKSLTPLGNRSPKHWYRYTQLSTIVEPLQSILLDNKNSYGAYLIVSDEFLQFVVLFIPRGRIS